MSIFARGYLVVGRDVIKEEEASLYPISVLIELDDRWPNQGSIISPACCNLLSRSPNLDWFTG